MYITFKYASDNEWNKGSFRTCMTLVLTLIETILIIIIIASNWTKMWNYKIKLPTFKYKLK